MKILKSKVIKIIEIILLCLVLLMVFSWFFIQTTKDDMIPEPTLKVVLHGMQTRDYWLDILVTERGDYEIFKSDEIKAAVDKLAKYEDKEGYHPAMLMGSDGPIYGRLRGVWIDENTFKHEFWGDGIPKEFKVAILTGDGDLMVSDAVKRNSYHSIVYFDIETSSITEDVMTDFGKVYEIIPWIGILIIFVVRLVLPVLIKISVGNALGFKSKHSTKIMLMTNIITQIILNILLLSQVFYGLKYALNIFIITSAVIVIIESSVYWICLKEQDKARRIITALISNIASAAAMYFLIYFIQWVSF